MDTNPIASLFSSIKQKTTNPFLGTLIVVWSISNWSLLYSFFTFDSYTNLEKRIASVEKYITDHQMFLNLIICIIESIIVLISTYFLINLSRYIINIYENRVTPLVYKWTNPNSVVVIEKYEQISNEKEQWFEKYEKERTSRIKFQADTLLQIEELKKEKETLENKYLEIATSILESDKQIQNLFGL